MKLERGEMDTNVMGNLFADLDRSGPIPLYYQVEQ